MSMFGFAFSNAAWAAGLNVLETDLGEYILQLANERPSHIVTPMAHKPKEEVGKLFAEKLGIPCIAIFPYTDPKLRDENGTEALNPDNRQPGLKM